MAGLTLYHAVPSRGAIVRWMLEETGQPYEIKLLDLQTGEQREPGYLAINPMGKVPALKHGDAVISEASAICCYLADAFPEAGLSVPVGDMARGPYLKWLFFSSACIEPAITDKAFKRAEEPPRGTLGYGDFDTVMDVLAEGLSGKRYLMGEQFTAADVVIGSALRWGMMFELIPAREEFVAYAARLAERPALRRATQLDEEISSGGA